MRTLKSIMVLGLALSTFTATEAAKLTFKVTNPNEKVKVRLTFSQSGEQKEVAIDAAGNGNIEITGFTPQYVTMQYTRGRRTLYLDPNQDLTLSFDSDNMWRNTTFEGAGAAINTYLGSKELQSLGMPDMKMQEAALIHKGDSLYAANCQVLEAAKLPADFTTQEKIRLQFYTYYYFSKYALYHPHFGKDDNYIPSKAYYEKLEAITPINASLLALKEYKAFLPDAISAFSNKGKTVASSSTEQSVNYVDATIQDEKVAEFLIDQFVYNFVDNNGLDEADGLIVLFRKHVKDAKSIEKFNALCTKWEKLRSGNPSAASFSYPDINGKTVSLADLKGKYIYIDVWATWCGPCRGCFFCKYTDTGIDRCLCLHTGSYYRCLGGKKRHCLTLHVRSHQRTVRIIVLQERNQCCSNGEHHLWRYVHVIECSLIVLLRFFTVTTGYGITNKMSILIQFFVRLRYMVIIFLIRSHVYNFVCNTRIVFI